MKMNSLTKDRGFTRRNISKFKSSTMERVAGIEPAWPAWKAGTLPLSYTRKEVKVRRFNLGKNKNQFFY